MHWLRTLEIFTSGSCCLLVASLFNERNKPISLGFSVIPTAQKQRARMTCSGNFKDFRKVRGQSLRGQPKLIDDTEDICMAQIWKDLRFRIFFLVSYFNQGIRHGRVFGLRTITLVAL